MWAVYARFEGGRVVHGISCYDPADSTAAPERPAWTTDVSESQIPVSKDAGGAESRSRHELLTLAERNVVFCSNAGSLVALDAATGRRAWGFRYPRGRKADANRTADPAPAVAVGGRVFVAPADADRIYALDAETGQSLWPPFGLTEGANIIGVSAGRLIVAVAGPVKDIRGLSLADGSYRTPEGWNHHDGGGLLGYGRGFVTDDLIVWPTHHGLYFLPSNPEMSSPGVTFRNPLGGPQAGYSGNVVYADGVLVVVTPTQVLGYVSETKRFGPPNPRSERDKFDRQVGAAENALAAGETAIARTLLLEAVRGDLPKPYRAWAAARLLLLLPKGDAESKLPADLRDSLATELLGEWLLPPDGIPVTLGTLLDRHLGRESASAFLASSPALPHERKPEDAPSLSLEAEIADTIKLGTGTAPLRWIPGMPASPKRLFVTTATQILAISLVDREMSRCGTTEVHPATDIPADRGRRPTGSRMATPHPPWVFNDRPVPARGRVRLIQRLCTDGRAIVVG